MTGRVCVLGLGPGAEGLVTPDAAAALAAASDILGYGPYVARVQPRTDQTVHASDNREELDRARHALGLAVEGREVVIVSSGDPGVFAMAAALFEALEAGPAEWRRLEVDVQPGITAMLAAAARIGAPLGHDFCAINLSDNLKPQTLIDRRLRLAAEADFAMAFYNPRSKARPAGFEHALEILRGACGPDRIVIFARAITTPEESLAVTTLGAATPEMADMRTLVIVGSSRTRVVPRAEGRRPWVYTPRSVPEGAC